MSLNRVREENGNMSKRQQLKLSTRIKRLGQSDPRQRVFNGILGYLLSAVKTVILTKNQKYTNVTGIFVHSILQNISRLVFFILIIKSSEK